MLSIQEWHKRFTQQAEWTKEARKYLSDKSGLNDAKSILDIGCGTGALLDDMDNLKNIQALDIDLDRLIFAKENHQDNPFVCGDAKRLPYPSDNFSIVYCHFLLLWVKSPEQVLLEMRRVGKPGGSILILAEPDYGGRIACPESLDALGKFQIESLMHQGADPIAGRKLLKWLHEVGLKEIEVGVLGGQWKTLPTKKEWELEWQVIESDLAKILGNNQLEQHKAEDLSAWQERSRLLYVPTFYAIGIIPK